MLVLQSPIVRSLLAPAACLAILVGTYRAGVSAGYAARELEQAEVDAATYAEIIKEMDHAGIDVSDPDAVLRELCRLAGRAGPEECSDL